MKGTFVTLWECAGIRTSLSSCADFDLALHTPTQQLLDKDETPTLEYIPHPPLGISSLFLCLPGYDSY